MSTTFATALLVLGTGVPAEPPPPPGPEGTRVVVAGPRYEAGGFHRFFLGDGYRATWTAPLRVPLMDLDAFGTFRPTRTGGGKQTVSLRFTAGDGRRLRFRSVDKDAARSVPDDLRDTIAEWVLQDQVSAMYPVGAPVVDHLRRAFGMPFVPRSLYVMPDDPRLGEFRAQFANMLGTLEERPRLTRPVTPGFEGVTEMIETADLMARLDASPEERIDADAFLEARMLDFVTGDWDRHAQQWDWLKREGRRGWHPFGTDTDMAFCNYEGLLPGLARNALPSAVTFDPRHMSVLGLSWNARDVDRRLLGGLERPAFLRAAARVQAGLGDAVIDEAIRRLPPEYFALDGAALAAALKQRRDRLPESAGRYYELLAREVEIYATDRADLAEVERLDDGALEVRLTAPGRSEPYYRRRLLRHETREVRLFLKGGDDRAVTHGRAGGIRIRVMGGGGDDTLDDTSGGGTEFFDHEGANQVMAGPGTRADDRPYVHPLDSRGYRRLDWGGFRFVSPGFSYGAEVGLSLGAKADIIRYGFRSHPWASRHRFGAVYAFGRGGPKVEYDGQWQPMNSRRRLRLSGYASDIEIIRFFGFGNDTDAPGPRGFYHSDQRQVLVQPSLRLGLEGVDVWVGPRLKYQETDVDQPTLLGQLQPYGVGDFGQLGLNVSVAADSRERLDGLGRGIRVAVEGSYYPKVWSPDKAFGEVHGEVAGYLRVLALRAGGKKVWGTYPFHEAAFIGGSRTLRGTARERYAGDASLFASAELRVPVVRFKFLVPVRAGLLGLADAGRVYLDGASPGRWHKGVGGGAWFSFLKPENTLTIAGAVDPDAPGYEGGLRVYVETGFAF